MSCQQLPLPTSVSASSKARAKPAAGALLKHLKSLGGEELLHRKKAADQAIRALGITFTVYSEGTNLDRQWPYDIIPRLLRRSEWDRIEQIGRAHV